MSVYDRTIIAPTVDEAGNLGQLAKNVRAAVQELPGVTRLLIIDDSDNNATIAAASSASAAYGSSTFQVEWYHRKGTEKTGGLSGAVICGMRMCHTEEFIGVIDGDGQHPADIAPAMFRVGELVDVVATSRNRSGGSAEGLDGMLRHLVSYASNKLAKLLFPRLLGELSDPMTGFFVIRRSAFDLDRLKPDGFKILVELVCTHPGLRVLEVPMRFGRRGEGSSKGDLKNGLKFLRQLVGLRFFTRRCRTA